MKTVKSLVAVLLSAVIVSCSSKVEEDPLKPVHSFGCITADQEMYLDLVKERGDSAEYYYLLFSEMDLASTKLDPAYTKFKGDLIDKCRYYNKHKH